MTICANTPGNCFLYVNEKIRWQQMTVNKHKCSQNIAGSIYIYLHIMIESVQMALLLMLK